MTTQFLRPTVLVVAALSSGVFGLTPAAAQQTLYVDADAPVGGDGTSWSTALNTLQGALDIAAVNGMVEAIRIAEGTYRPSHETVPGDARSATFQLLNGVAFYGGYPGFDAADPDLRDVDTHMTILSGDLNDDDATVGRDENAYHVLTGAGADSTAIVDGFTITAGNADATDPDDIGGGMYNSNGSPTLVQCTFSKNFATYGAGMFNLDNSSPTLVQCAFRFNIASFSGGGMYNQIDSSPAMIDCEFTDNVADPASSGGGLLNHQNCNAWLTRCIFLNNSAAAGGGILNVQSSPRLTDCTLIENTGADGAGIYNYIASNPIVVRCLFWGNMASNAGAGMVNWESSPIVENSTFVGNSATNGAGMYNYLDSSPQLTGCTFSGNTATGSGGGLYNLSNSQAVLVNCTFSGNSVSSSGGAVYSWESTPTVANSIAWGNRDGFGEDEFAQFGGNAPVLTRTCVQGCTSFCLDPGAGNTGSNPMLVDSNGLDDLVGTADDDLRVLPGSPCIDAGSNGVLPADAGDLDGDGDTGEPVPTDLDGHARILCLLVDMGAYEFGLGDYNCDEDVNLADYAAWDSCMTGPLAESYGPGCEAFDAECDGNVDLADFAGLQPILFGGYPRE